MFPGVVHLGSAQLPPIDHPKFRLTIFVSPQSETPPSISNSRAQRFVTIADFGDNSFHEFYIQRSLELKAGRRRLQWSVVFLLVDKADFLKR